MIPSLSTTITALVLAPRSSFHRSKAIVALPLGWKSDSSGYGNPPKEVDHAR